MLATINFNHECADWSLNSMVNHAFVWNQINYMYDRVRLRGYIYLNEIYDLFGARWDPHDSNACLNYSEGGINFTCSVEQLNDTDYKITICY